MHVLYSREENYMATFIYALDLFSIIPFDHEVILVHWKAYTPFAHFEYNLISSAAIHDYEYFDLGPEHVDDLRLVYLSVFNLSSLQCEFS